MPGKIWGEGCDHGIFESIYWVTNGEKLDEHGNTACTVGLLVWYGVEAPVRRTNEQMFYLIFSAVASKMSWMWGG